MLSHTTRTERLFFGALEIESEAERIAFLDSACDGDAQVRRAVDKLLRAHSKIGLFLTRPAVDQFAVSTKRLETTSVSDAPADESNRDGNCLDFLQPSRRSDSLGRIGHYEVLEVLGRGGFGTVFRAIDETLQRTVAVKVLSPRLAAELTARKRFVAEARSYARIRHVNVVQVYSVQEQALPFLVMEFVPGETLQQRLNRTGPLDVMEVVRIARQLAEGLAATHARGLIHRDVKPENILLESNCATHPGEALVKISDFGLAHAVDDDSLSQSGAVAGTPMFMSPEQAMGETLDHRADLFSLGSVCYAMCCGHPPFRGKNTFDILSRVVEDTPQPIRDVVPETPEWLCDIIARLHAKNRNDRFASAREVAELFAHRLALMQPASNFPGSSDAAPQHLALTNDLADASLTTRPRISAWAWRCSVAVCAMVIALFAGLGVTEAINVADFHTAIVRLFSREEIPVVQGDAPAVGVRRETLPETEADQRFTEMAAWERSVASMPAGEQEAAIVARFKDLNPGFDGSYKDTSLRFEASIQSPRLRDLSPVRAVPGLTALFVQSAGVTDLTPLHGLNLRSLNLFYSRVSDLAPLHGMKLLQLDLSGSVNVKDLSPLAGLPLQDLSIAYTQVSDLTPLKEMELTSLNCDSTPVLDLSPLEGMRLTNLGIHNTKAFDLSPLEGMPLVSLNCDNSLVSDADLAHIRGCKSLRHLRLLGTKVSVAGVEELQKALPDCQIEWNDSAPKPK